jgi:peptide/nickel transport system substrate-binding protein
MLDRVVGRFAARKRALSLCVVALTVVASSGWTAAGAAPAKGVNPNGVLRYGSYLPAFFQGPAPSQAAACGYAYQFPIYDTLVHEIPGTQVPEPGLATSWSTPNRSTLVLHLRSGVHFQNGQAFTAAAVVAGLNANRAATSSIANQFANVSSISAVNPSTVKIEFSTPSAATFPQVLAGPGGEIALPDKSSPIGFVGAGPFEVASYTAGSSLVLKRWPGYVDAKSNRLGGIDFSTVLPNAPSVAALKSGSIDMAEFAPESLPSLTGLQTVTQLREMYYLMSFNLKDAPFNNQDFRQALNYAADRRAIDHVIDLGKGQPSGEPYPSVSIGYSGAAQDKYKYDLALAKKMIKKSGLKTPITIKVVTPPPVEVGLTEIADILKQDFAQIGVNMVIDAVPVTAFLTDYYKDNDGQAAVVLWTPPSDPIQTLTEQFTSAGFANASHYANPGDYTNPTLNSLIAKAEQATTAKAEGTALQQATNFVVDHALSMPLTFSPLTTAYDSQVGGKVIALNYCGGYEWTKLYMKG